MKPTKDFKNIIKSYLDTRAKEDELFAVSYAKEGKNIDDCITSILNTVQKSGCNGFVDHEIFSMAVHYYDEDSIKIGKPVSARVVVNHTAELTEKDKEQAKADAMKQLQEEFLKDMKKPKKQKKEPEVKQIGLFDEL